MSKTVGHWANLPSYGCFVYLEQGLGESPAACRALIEKMLEVLGLGPDNLKISTKTNYLQWSKFAWKKVETAIGGELSATFMAGEPSDVHLAGRIVMREEPSSGVITWVPPQVWLAAESVRWPEDRFAAVARSWFQTLAEHGRPLSGGAFASGNMRNAKVEACLEYESFEGERADETFEQLRNERHGSHAWDKIRRIYPVTLIGPKLAAQTSAEQLREAGAASVTAVGGSLIVEASGQLVEAWSPDYLEATKRLRELVWPWSFQHPLDDPKRKPRQRPRKR